MFDFAYADDIVFLSSCYSEMQGLLEAIYRHATAVGVRINSTKTKVLSAFIHGSSAKPSCLIVSP